MTTLTCPACRTTLTVTHADTPAPGRHRLPAVPDGAPVRQLVEGLHGHVPFATLRSEYDRRAAAEQWPDLSDKALARQLRALGATPYRTGTQRGFTFA